MSTPTPKPKRPRGRAQLLAGKCIACGARCESSCPVNCITMNDAGEPLVQADKCIGCLKCVKVCPAQALEMVFTPGGVGDLGRTGQGRRRSNRRG